MIMKSGKRDQNKNIFIWMDNLIVNLSTVKKNFETAWLAHLQSTYLKVPQNENRQEKRSIITRHVVKNNNIELLGTR